MSVSGDDAVDAILADLSPERRQTFELRVARWSEQLRRGVELAYGPERTQPVVDSLLALAARMYAARDDDLHRLDEQRLLRPDWFQTPQMLGYACYTERFAGDLRGVMRHTDYLGELGVSYLHLMPLMQARPGDSDGGYAVQDYRQVRADLGTVDDLRALTSDLRGKGISLVLDLVLNHVAREHDWAVRARAGEQRYRDYFHVFADRSLPDRYEQTLPEVFPDFAPGNFTWDADLPGWVWTTFNEFQWDVNWANPDVLLEYADIILFMANLGVEVIRLDAIAFIWKRLGTTCQGEPEVHALTSVLRAIARIVCPAVLFKAEAIVGPRDLAPYLGTGAFAGAVSDLAYHNSLMVQIWSMLTSGDTNLAAHALRNLPATPTGTGWITYARCHDDIGWAIDDGDAAALGISGWAHRRFLADWYAGEFPGSWADGLVFQENEETGDKRTSGTCASLVGLGPAESAAAAALSEGAQATTEPIDAALARHFLAHAIAIGWGGIPVIWSGDELAQPNDAHFADEPGHADDNRWAHRPRLDWQRAAARDDLDTVPGKVFQGIAHLARTRARLPQLHAAAAITVIDGLERGVLGVERSHASGRMTQLYNVTDGWLSAPAALLDDFIEPWNALEESVIRIESDGRIWLAPYSASWIIDRADTPDRAV